jgi:hypothetical protein
MNASTEKLPRLAVLIALVLASSPGAISAATIQNALRCSSAYEGQYEVGDGVLRPSEEMSAEHTYTYPEKEGGPYKLWPIDKYGRLAKDKVQNIHELELQPDIIFVRDNALTVCIVLRLTHAETGNPVVNKSLKHPDIKYVQWAFVIPKDLLETDDPIVLEVLFSETTPGNLEKAELFRLEAFVPRSGGKKKISVMEPLIALEMDE